MLGRSEHRTRSESHVSACAQDWLRLFLIQRLRNSRMGGMFRKKSPSGHVGKQFPQGESIKPPTSSLREAHSLSSCCCLLQDFPVACCDMASCGWPSPRMNTVYRAFRIRRAHMGAKCRFQLRSERQSPTSGTFAKGDQIQTIKNLDIVADTNVKKLHSNTMPRSSVAEFEVRTVLYANSNNQLV